MSDREYVIHRGHVAMLYNACYGGYDFEDRFDADTIFKVLANTFENDKYSKVRVAWIPLGSPYYIHEYDGKETVALGMPPHDTAPTTTTLVLTKEQQEALDADAERIEKEHAERERKRAEREEKKHSS